MGMLTENDIAALCGGKKAKKRAVAEAAPKTKRDYARELYEGGMRCNCDLDNWEPEHSTGHSHVCRIHKAVLARAQSEDPRKKGE